MIENRISLHFIFIDHILLVYVFYWFDLNSAIIITWVLWILCIDFRYAICNIHISAEYGVIGYILTIGSLSKVEKKSERDKKIYNIDIFMWWIRKKNHK